MNRDKSIDLFEIINSNTNKPIISENMDGGNYKQIWYKKNSKNVKNYNKEYYEKHKNKIKKNSLKNYNSKKILKNKLPNI
jgi:hypothetical protein